jgi:hypothetical protein
MIMPKTAAEKLGIKPGDTVMIVNAPQDPPLQGGFPERVTVHHGRGHTEPDVVVLFAHDSTQLHGDAPGLLAPLTDAVKVWIAYRKKGVSELSRDVLMPALTGIGWHGVSLVSIDDSWSAARFRLLEHIGH